MINLENAVFVQWGKCLPRDHASVYKRVGCLWSLKQLGEINGSTLDSSFVATENPASVPPSLIGAIVPWNKNSAPGQAHLPTGGGLVGAGHSVLDRDIWNNY